MTSLRPHACGGTETHARRGALIRELKEYERKLMRVIRQIHLLNDRMQGLTSRIQAARCQGNHCFRYALRMRINVAEGVCYMMHEYARDIATTISDRRRKLFNQHVTIESSDDETENDDVTDNDDDLVSI